MDFVLLLLRWGVFALSLCGWFCLAHRIPRLNFAFLPVVTLSALVVVLFSAGMVHLLFPVTWILLAGGWLLFLFHLASALRKRFSFAFLRTPGMVFFWGAVLLFVPVLFGVHLYHYDNFSHWGTVLGEMFAFDDFPTAQTIVVFRDYAPGTTSFLYLFGTVVGTGEDVALMGQAMLSFAALSALFFRVKKARSVRFFATALLALVLTCMLVFDDGTLQVFNLLVDALIAFVAASAWFIREEYRDRPVQGWLLMIPVLVFLVLIKMNAAVLLIFFALILVYDALKYSAPLRKRVLCLLPLVLPLLWILFWRFYRHATYGTAADSYGYSGFWHQITSQPPEFFLSVLRQTWTKITDFSQIYVSGFLGVNALLAGGWIYLLCRKKDRTRLGKTILIVNGLMLGYLLCMVFLYCFIMTPEASNLAAFERYMVTPLIVFTAIGIESLFDVFAQSGLRCRFAPWMPLAVSAFLFLFVAKNSVQLVCRPDFSAFERGQVMDVLKDGAPSIPRNASVAMFNGSRRRRDLYYYLMMYEVKSRRCFVLDFGQPQHSIPIDTNMLQSYEYLVVAAQDSRLREELIHAGFVLTWDPDCTLYRIAADGYGRMTVSPVN